jgi:hypothetical protein
MPLPEQVPLEAFRRSPDVVSRVVADEAIVVPIRRGAGDLDSIYTFNESGTKLWAMIEAGRSAADLASYLLSEYGLTPEQAAADAERFVKELANEGLIVPA